MRVIHQGQDVQSWVNPLTRRVTKTEFLLTISIQNESDKG